MGTDTFERTKSCPCGKGKIVITTSSPDHGYASAYNVHHSFEIVCENCALEYIVDGTRLVLRTDKDLENAARKQYRVASDEFNASTPVLEVKNEFGLHLDGMRSIAAIHRYLKQQGLESYEISSFRRHWHGGLKWADDSIRSSNMRKVLELLGQNPTRFEAEIKKIEELYAAIPSVPTVMTCLP